MLDFLSNNISTIIVGLILLGIVILVIRTMIKDKQLGKSSCGCGCNHCPNSELCHKPKT